MPFPFNFYLTAFVAAGVASAVTLPFWRRFCLWFGLIDDPGHRKIHDAPIPLAGGLAVFTGLVLPIMGGWMALHFHWLDSGSSHLLSHGFQRRGLELAGIVAGATGMLALGL